MAHEIYYEVKYNAGFPDGSTVKECLPMQETQEMQVWSLCWEDPWRRQWHPTAVFLLGQSRGQRSLLGYSPWGLKESDATEQLTHTKEWPASVGGPCPFRKEQKAPLQPLKPSMWLVVHLPRLGTAAWKFHHSAGEPAHHTGIWGWFHLTSPYLSSGPQGSHFRLLGVLSTAYLAFHLTNKANRIQGDEGTAPRSHS